MTKDYIEDECGAKFPLNYTFDGVNNFVFSTDVMFEDLQALCLGLVAKLEAAEQGLHPTSGILPDLQAVSTPQPLASSQALSTPPTCG